MTISERQVREAVRAIWTVQLGLEIADAVLTADELQGDTVTASVNIHGDFTGSVLLRGSRALVRRAAEVMFVSHGGPVTDDDQRDVAGELANVIAGNLKALVPGHSSISLPTVIEGSAYSVHSLDASASREVGFTVDGEPMVVTVVEHTINS
jgi:chemotaxis protein CheX